MDKNLIYAKTDAGAEAIRTRTRVVRRNQRMVLVLVDGKSTVGALGEKTSNPQLVMEALAALEREGFITRVGGSAADGANAIEEAGGAGKPILRLGAAAAIPGRAAWRQQLENRLAAWRSRSKPGRRATRRVFWGLGVLVAALGVLLFFPVDRYRSDLEADLSGLTGQPVRAEDLRLAAYPAPGLVLDKVVIGSDPGGVRFERVRLVPTLTGWWGSPRSFHEIEIDGAVLSPGDLSSVSRWLQAGRGGRMTPTVGRVSLRNLAVELADLRFAGLSGEIQAAEAGGGGKLVLNGTDPVMRLEVVPSSSGVDLVFEAFAWHPVRDLALSFASLQARGQLVSGSVKLAAIEGRVLDGLVQGQLDVDWRSGIRTRGAFTAKGISARKFAEAFGVSPRMEGELSASFQQTAEGRDFAGLAATTRIEGQFLAQRGSLNGFDFVDATRRTAARPSRGGNTNFEELKGRLEYDSRGLRLSGMELSSGPLQLLGHVDIDRKGHLSGVVDTRLRGSVNQVRQSVGVSGSLAAPELSGR